MCDDLVTYVCSIEQGHHPVSMTLDLSWNFLSHKRAFCIPSQQYLVMLFIPHQSKWIELTIKRTLFIDAAI
jgi:hypothetical protein